MDQTIYKGTISFIHHDKQYAVIDYEQNDKKKSINFKIDGKEQPGPGDKKKKTKEHRFRIGDEVNFQIKLSDRGERMIAYDIRFLYNTALERLIDKAKTENRFSGFLKMVDERLYVKERDSYIFFPLTLSKWEKPPAESAFNEVISFKLLNPDKPNAIAAELFFPAFIPEYLEALKYYKNKTPVEATVSKVSPFAIYLDLIGNKIQAKMELPAKDLESIKPGDSFTVKISYLSNSRIVVEKI